jgi:putative Ca2+/H+ antiporter (TMEM165/GDT1 family)
MAELSTQQKRVWAVALTGIVLSLGIVTVLTVVWGVVMARPLPIRAERRTVIATVARPGVLVASDGRRGRG